MLNLIEIMRAAQGGEALDNLARQFAMSPEDARTAVAALLPAFAMGLSGLAARPDAMSALIGRAASGGYAPFFESAAAAFSPQAREQGVDALAQMLGRPDDAARVAQEVSALTGIATEAIGKMMPILAAMLMGGLAKAASPTPARSAPAPAKRAPAASRAEDNPYEAMFATMLGLPPKPEPEPEPEPEAPAHALFEAYRDMVQTGRNLHDAQLASLRTLFEALAAKT